MRRNLNMLAIACLGLAGCVHTVPLQPAPRLACYRVADPYAGPGAWYRGNFHMHSTHSDGALEPEKLVELYNRNGFSVLCISDHNQYGDQDGGILPFYQSDSLAHDWNGDGEVYPERVFGSGVESYVRDYTRPQALWKRDLWYRGETNAAEPVLLSGAEMSHVGWHFGVIGLQPGAVESPNGGMGYIRRARDAGGLVFLAHPGEWNDTPGRLAGLLDLRPFEGIEIMNGLRLTKSKPALAVPPDQVPSRGAEDCAAGNLPPDATPLWDGLLARGYRLWGFANDDEHTWEGAPEAYPFVAFDMLWASERSADGFMQALHNGAFYGSTGLYFRQIGMVGDSLVAWAPEADQVRFIGWGGRLLAAVAAPRAAYRVTGTEGYIRVEVAGSPRASAWSRQAWSQPFYIEPAPCGATLQMEGN